MKKSLLTLSLVVGCASVVSAAKPTYYSRFTAKAGEARTQASQVAGKVKNHFSTHGRKWAYGTAAVATTAGLGFGGHKLYKNPKMVRTARNFANKYSRRGLSLVKGHKLATGLSLGGLLTAGLVYKYQEPIKAFGTKATSKVKAFGTNWIVNPTKKAWNKRPALLWNK